MSAKYLNPYHETAAEWLPKAAADSFKSFGAEAVEIANRLLWSPEMVVAWKTLERLDRSENSIQAIDLLAQCIFARSGYREEPSRGPAAHRAHYMRIADAARELARMVSWDERLSRLSPLWERVGQSSELEQIAANAEQVAREGTLTPRPNAKNSHRSFLIRHLSRHCRERLGSPHHELVAAVASAVIGDTITIDLVKKLTKGLGEHSRPRQPRKRSLTH